MRTPSLTDALPQPLKDRLGIAREAALQIWLSPRHRYFTDHRPDSHSQRIVQKLDRLLAELPPDDALSPKEAFALLASAYLHDIGMQAENQEWTSLEDVRENHHVMSREMIVGSVRQPDRFRDLGLTQELVDEVGLVSAAHRRLDLTLPEFDPRPKGDETLRLRFLSALLRLADSLDMDYRRVDMERLKEASVPQTSRLYWWRCHYVEAIVIENGVVGATCEVPSEDYVPFVRISIERELQDAVGKVQGFLWPTIRLVAGPARVAVSETKQAMSADDFGAFRRSVLEELRSSTDKAVLAINTLHDQEERIASVLTEEAARLRETNPAQAAEFLELAAEGFRGLGMMRPAGANLHASADLYRAHGMQAKAVRAYERLGDLWLDNDDAHSAHEAFKSALEVTPEGDEVARARLTASLARSLALLGHVPQALHELDQLEGVPSAEVTSG